MCKVTPISGKNDNNSRFLQVFLIFGQGGGAVMGRLRCVSGARWCDDGLPPPPGWHHGVPIGGPRMSPTPRSAKYGATHSCNPSRGSENVRLRSSSPHRAHHRIALPRAATLAASPCATTRHAAPRCTAPPRSAARATLRRSRLAMPYRTSAPPHHALPRAALHHSEATLSAAGGVALQCCLTCPTGLTRPTDHGATSRHAYGCAVVR